MLPENLLTIAIIILAGSLIQGMAGFAFALFAVPALLWTGADLPSAVIMVSIASFVQTAFGSWQLRDAIPWKLSFQATLVRIVTIALGLMLMFLLDGLDKDRLKQYLGILLLVILIARFFYKPGGESHEPPAVWKYTAFSFSGLLQGMVAMGGPPMVLWLMARHCSAREARGFMLSVFLLSSPYQLALLYYFAGPEVRGVFLTGAFVAPLAAVGSYVGVRIGNRFSKQTLDRCVLALLFLMVISCVLAPYL